MLSRNKVVLTEVGAGVKNPSLIGRASVFETEGYRFKSYGLYLGAGIANNTKKVA